MNARQTGKELAPVPRAEAQGFFEEFCRAYNQLKREEALKGTRAQKIPRQRAQET